MDLIEHNDVFELLSFETGYTEEELKELLIRYGKKAFIDFTIKNGLSIFKSNLSLGAELTDQNGQILLNTGVPLAKYLEILLERYVKDTRYKTSTLKISCTPEALTSYKEKSEQRIDGILNDYILSQDKYSAFFDSVRDEKSEVRPFEIFKKSISYMLSFPMGISSMVKIFRNTSAKRELLTDNINSALISATLSYHCGSRFVDDADAIKVKIALTAVLQDIATLMECDRNETCIEQSSIIANHLVNDSAIEEAIRVKHCYMNADNVPVFSDVLNKSNFFLRMLITVNLFVEVVKINKTDPSNLEVHKSMYELAELGYADKDITTMLSRLFLPEVKHLVLQYAYTIKNNCPVNPIIWSTIGDMLPVKFLCAKQNCAHAGLHKTFIPEDVKIEAEEIYQTRINAGMYHTCKSLTDKLQEYYKSISQQ